MSKIKDHVPRSTLDRPQRVSLSSAKREPTALNGGKKRTVIRQVFLSLSLLVCTLVGSLMLGNVSVFVQLIFGPRRPMHQLKKNPNIA